VDGKPRIISQRNLGSADEIAERLSESGPGEPARTQHLKFGDVAAVWGVLDALAWWRSLTLSPSNGRAAGAGIWQGWSRNSDAHHRFVQRLSTHRPSERRVPESEDATVEGDFSVSGTGRGAGDADHRLVESMTTH